MADDSKFIVPEPPVGFSGGFLTEYWQQTTPLPGTVGRVTNEPRRLGKAGAAGDMMGEKLLPGEERCYCWDGHGGLLCGMGGGAVTLS